MVSQIVLRVVCCLHLVSVIAGSDVITFNQEELDDDNIDTVLETEHLIQVVDRRGSRPASYRGSGATQHSAKKYVSPNSLTHKNNVLQQPAHTSNVSFPQQGNNGADVTNKNVYKSRSTMADENWKPSESWESLSDSFPGNEIDDLLTSEGIYVPTLSRSKRALYAGSGEVVIKIQFVSRAAAISSRPQLSDALKIYLQSMIKSILQVEATAIVSNTIQFDVLLETGMVQIVDLAQALVTLDKNDNFKVNGVLYPVSSPMLSSFTNTTLRPAVCFLCRTYQVCLEKDLICKVKDERLFAHGIMEGDKSVPPNNEFAVQQMILESPIIYGNEQVNKVYVSPNGMISFSEPFTSYSPHRCPVIHSNGKSRQVLPIYWADLDVVSNDEGAVYSQVYTRTSMSTAKTQAVLDKATERVWKFAKDYQFKANLVIVITWSELAPWPVRSGGTERVTFQAVIISNGQKTYVLYLYAQGAMNLNPALQRNVRACFKDTNLDTSVNNFYRFDTVIGNTNFPGQWFYQLGNLPNSRARCIDWFERNLDFLSGLYFWNWIIQPCPCNEFMARFSFLWIPSAFENRCYDTFPLYGQIGRRCCYRRDGSFENRMPFAGSLQLYTPYFSNFAQHQEWDGNPKRHCCRESNLCHLYYIARPTTFCTSRFTWIALFFGDPHIVTLDNQQFIFNGHGEYRLLEIQGELSDNRTVDFQLQGRTCRAKTSDGSLSNATVFCAFALRNTNNGSFTVEISASSNSSFGTYMIIYINDQDYTVRIRDNPSFNDSNGGIYVQKVNNSVKVSTSDSVGITIKLLDDALDFTIEVDSKFQGKTKGLLGNFNGNQTDDLIFPNGTQLPSTSSERRIFEYGQTWAVVNSIFKYAPGEDSSNHTDQNFIPIFLDEVDPAELAAAKNICKSANNLACIYDYFATRSEQFALNTRDIKAALEETEAQITNRPPNITKTLQVNAIVNEATTFEITADDPDNDTFVFILMESPDSSFTYVNGSDTFNVTFLPRNLNDVSISVAAVDAKGLESEITEVYIKVCSGCSQNGSCNFEDATNTSNAYFSIATCDCKFPYSGDNCEEDKDGCANDPCPEKTNCTDVPAHEEIKTNESFKCSNCTAGFELNGFKCEDIDECENAPCQSNANCTNIYGSYICTCNEGYRETSTGTCNDINECVENQHKCNQICINVPGTYTCSCEEGFKLMDQFHCKSNGLDPCANLTNSAIQNCSYGCQNSSGVAQCFCPTGYKLAPDGYSCEDINECSENLCSQSCNNTDGSYTCLCYDGYFLTEDHLSCAVCLDDRYGDDCKTPCNCRGRATTCDPVKGCNCVDAWTGPNCEIDVNECVTQVDPCPRDQVCNNTDGSYTCNCPTGYVDTYKNGSCYNIDECLDASVHNCSFLCVDNPGSYTCVCDVGYNAVGRECKDIDECQLGISGCEQNCTNMEGSFNCYCRLGYRLGDDRKSCEKDLDPCRDFNMDCSYACDIVENSPQCYCKIGFVLGNDNKTCNDIDECSTSLNNCTEKCVNTQGSYNCSCSDGKQLANDKRSCEACDAYHWGPNCGNDCACDPIGSEICNPITGCQCKSGWSGRYCNQDRNECDLIQSVCPALSTCINTFGSYMCLCGQGYLLNNNTCLDIDECESKPCDHTCTNTIGSYRCSCYDGFLAIGDKCLDINECTNPQQSKCDQLCRNTAGGFTCECRMGYILNTTTRNTCYRDPTAKTCGINAKCEQICVFENLMEKCYCLPGYEIKNNTNCTDIDECTTSPCVNGNCTNLEGSFSCACGDGFKLATDQVTCQECQPWFYGSSCSSQCDCNITNTNRCIPTNGTCECNGGWNGLKCSDDIDECTEGSAVCGSNSNCRNIPGSYKCVCKIGFYPTGNGDCLPCDVNHYGQDCVNICSCVPTNTKNCDDVNGTCECLNGWTGSDCGVDVDECVDNSVQCPNNTHEQCFNYDGGAECRCKDGYYKPSGGNTCKECEPWFFGSNCLSSCVCNLTNTNKCYNVDGKCECKTGWSGSACTDDIDECKGNPTCGSNSHCVNVPGSYNCECNFGFYPSEKECLASRVYFVQISLRYNETQIASFGKIFDNTTDDFKKFAVVVEKAILDYGKRILPVQLIGIRITKFYKGSVVANTSVYIDEKKSTNPPGDAAKLMHVLNTDRSLLIGNIDVTINNISVGSEPLSEKNSLALGTGLCDVLSKIENCPAGECDEKSVTCKPLPSGQAGNKTDLIIGLAVGIPLFILLVIAVALLAFLYVRRKRKSEQQSSSQSIDHAAPFRNMFATRVSTKGSWGAPHQMPGLDNLSDTATNVSGIGGLLKSRPTGRSDFQDSAWYDNRGASSSGAANSRETPTEAAGPTSNFSWEYMFRLLEPHKDFEIQRPYIENTPNPTYVKNTKNHDSAA